MNDKGHGKDTHISPGQGKMEKSQDFVLEKSIFSNIFERDIRRVYIYKKAERLAKALYLIAPALRQSTPLESRFEAIALALVDAALLPPSASRPALSRELLALSSALHMARAGGIISRMNAELIAHEAENLLGEVASYEEPRIFLEETPTLAALFRSVAEPSSTMRSSQAQRPVVIERAATPLKDKSKGQTSDVSDTSRRSAIISILKTKGPSYIKDISTVVRSVSEKTIQRELSALVAEGKVAKSGERRWTSYRLADEGQED